MDINVQIMRVALGLTPTQGRFVMMLLTKPLVSHKDLNDAFGYGSNARIMAARTRARLLERGAGLMSQYATGYYLNDLHRTRILEAVAKFESRAV
jgi:hypothetical protein